MSKRVKSVEVIEAKENISLTGQIQNPIKKVAAYCRVSTDHIEQKTSYEAQVDEYTKRIKATIDDQEISLTKKEFEILKLLLTNKGNVFSREEILSHIWKDEVYVLDRTIDVNITRLRKKIGCYGKNIVTRLGFGYCFEG